MLKFRDSIVITMIIFIASVGNSQAGSYIIKLMPQSALPLSITDKAIDDKFYKMANSVREAKRPQLLSNKQSALLGDIGRYIVVDLNDAELKTLEDNPAIEQIFPNNIYRIEETVEINDPDYSRQWSLDYLEMEKAWEIATGENILIGVVDTGIDPETEELQGQLWINSAEDINHDGKFTEDDLNGIDEDGNGFVDDVLGYDMVDQSYANLGDDKVRDANPYDEHGHGTNVSSVIAARAGNGKAIAGMAYNSRILSVRAFDVNGAGEADDIAMAIIYAALQGANVLNFSFGEDYDSPLLRDAVEFATSMGCIMISSSGNNNWPYAHYPSNYPEVICIGSIDSEGQKASLSNWGLNLDFVAPGEQILMVNPGNDLAKKNGTSFSAPHVSALVAMMLEKSPGLTYKEVRSIISTTARDLGSTGWDLYYGAGCIAPYEALSAVGTSELLISYPGHESYVKRQDMNALPIVATVASPLFESYQLYLGEGQMPSEYMKLTEEIFGQVSGDTIARINMTELKDTVYTLTLMIKLKNGKTIQRHNTFWLLDQNSLPVFRSVNVVPNWNGPYKTVMLTAQLSQPVLLTAEFRPEGSQDDYIKVSNNYKYENYCYLHIPITKFPADQNYELRLTARRKDGTSISKDTIVHFTKYYTGDGLFNISDYQLPDFYLINKTGDMYGDGSKCFAVLDLSGGQWGKAEIWKQINGDFVKTDSSSNLWFPRDIGDSNGDGIDELLCAVNRQAKLFQAKDKNSPVFANTLYSDPENYSNWAALLHDFDGDGMDDIITYSDTSFHCRSYKDGKYKLISSTYLPSNLRERGFDIVPHVPGVAAGDFDGDGLQELAYTNWNGQLFVFEYANDGFRFEYTDSTKRAYGEQIMKTADLDADGTPELVQLAFGTRFAFGSDYYGQIMWTMYTYDNTGNDQYELMPGYTESFHGVRAGSAYNNGLSTGNIDGRPGDEVIVTTFNDFYVFKYTDSGYKAINHIPNIISNSVIIDDFTADEKNDILVNTYSGGRIFEFAGYDTYPPAVLNLRGWATSDTTARLTWNKEPGQDSYAVYELFFDGEHYYRTKIATTTDNIIDIGALEKNRYYEYFVVALADDHPNQESLVDRTVEVFTHSLAAPLKVTSVSQEIMYVSYSNHCLPAADIGSANFSLRNANADLYEPLSAIALNDSLIRLNFGIEIKPGDYDMLCGEFTDKYGSPVNSGNLSFAITPDEEEEQYMILKRLEIISDRVLHLYYSEPVSKAGAELTANYILKPFGEIASVALGQDSDMVEIVLTDKYPLAARGVDYTLTVLNVTAESGKDITKGAGNTLGFVFSAGGPEDAYVYPHPVRFAQGQQLMFSNLPQRARIDIYSENGQHVATIYEEDGNGGTRWDGTTLSGERAHQGVYIYQVTDTSLEPDGKQSEMKKFVIVD